MTSADRLLILAPTPTGSLTSKIYDQLRREIVNGTIVPGQRLRIEALCARFSVGGSPVREALSRLSSEGFASYEDQKGFRAAPVSLEELIELTRTRCQVNAIALQESIARGDAAWEEAIVLARHRLKKFPSHLTGAGRPVNPEWERLHRAFHTALIAACGSRWLLHFCEMLFDYGERYRNLAPAVRGSVRDVAGEHDALMTAVIERQTETAIVLLDEHVQKTARDVQGTGVFAAAPGANGRTSRSKAR